MEQEEVEMVINRLGVLVNYSKNMSEDLKSISNSLERIEGVFERILNEIPQFKDILRSVPLRKGRKSPKLKKIN